MAPLPRRGRERPLSAGGGVAKGHLVQAPDEVLLHRGGVLGARAPAQLEQKLNSDSKFKCFDIISLLVDGHELVVPARPVLVREPPLQPCAAGGGLANEVVALFRKKKWEI